MTPVRLSPRPLALLARLASAGDDGVPRDVLLAMLWPEFDEEHARNNLKQLVFGIRRALGHDVIAGDARTLRVDARALASDVREFGMLLDRGSLEAADALYRGPFLDGFRVSGADGFDRWMEDEREHLARRHAESVEVLARRAVSAGAVHHALRWWRRLVELDPLRDSFALGLARALVDAGHRDEAIQSLHRHEQRMEQDLGTRPCREARVLLERLRRDSAEHAIRESLSESALHRAFQPAPRAQSLPSSPAGTEGNRPPGSGRGNAPAASRESPGQVAEPASERRRTSSVATVAAAERWRRYRRTTILALVVIDALVLGLTPGRAAGRGELAADATGRSSAGVVAHEPVAPDGPSLSRLAVMPFLEPPVEHPHAICERFADVLVDRLDESSGIHALPASVVRAVDPPAEARSDPVAALFVSSQLDARYLLLGVLQLNGEELRVRLRYFDTARVSQPLARADVSGSVGDLMELADRVATLLESQVGSRTP